MSRGWPNQPLKEYVSHIYWMPFALTSRGPKAISNKLHNSFYTGRFGIFSWGDEGLVWSLKKEKYVLDSGDPPFLAPRVAGITGILEQLESMISLLSF